MRLSLLIKADAALLLVAAIAFFAQLPTNVDSPDQSRFYYASFWVAVVALVLLVVLVGAWFVQPLIKRNVKP